VLTVPFIIYGLLIKLINNVYSKGSNHHSFFLNKLYDCYWLISLVVAFLFIGSFVIHPIKMINDLFENPVIAGWTIDYFFASLVTIIFFLSIGYYVNDDRYTTIPFCFLYFTSMPFALNEYSSQNCQIKVTNPKVKYGLIFSSIVAGFSHLIIWLPDILDWADTHCWLDDSFPYATNTWGGQLIVMIIIMYFLSIITHVWTEYNIIIGIIMTFVAFNNVTISIVLLSVYLVNRNIIYKSQGI